MFLKSFSVAFLLITVLCLWGKTTNAQPISISSIYAKQTTGAERLKRRTALYQYTILPLQNQQPDSTNEYLFQDALWSISQYLLNDDGSRAIVDTLMQHYDSLELPTKRALMEVVYSLFPAKYIAQVKNLWLKEKDDRLLAVMAFYLKKNSLLGQAELDKRLQTDKQHYDSSAVLQQLSATIFPPVAKSKGRTFEELFSHQAGLHTKVIYSLQRPDRNFPGIAIIQNEDGSFVKDSITGKLKTFVQLARSAADLPYFITNGSTPQGAYRIKGTEVSRNNAIGPTPNLQMRMPFEVPADTFFIKHGATMDSTEAAYKKEYEQLFPSNWLRADMYESFYAGKCGRGAIIAHGTTLDPWYYQSQSFYPCTPTLGCLCAKEIWNPVTGRLLQSDQLDMINAFLATPGTDGYLYVINLDDIKRAVTPEDAMALVNMFQNKK